MSVLERPGLIGAAVLITAGSLGALACLVKLVQLVGEAQED